MIPKGEPAIRLVKWVSATLGVGLALWIAIQGLFVARVFLVTRSAYRDLDARLELPHEDVVTLKREVEMLIPVLLRSSTGLLSGQELPEETPMLRHFASEYRVDLMIHEGADGAVDVDVNLAGGLIRAGFLVRQRGGEPAPSLPRDPWFPDRGVRTIGSNVWRYLD